MNISPSFLHKCKISTKLIEIIKIYCRHNLMQRMGKIRVLKFYTHLSFRFENTWKFACEIEIIFIFGIISTKSYESKLSCKIQPQWHWLCISFGSRNFQINISIKVKHKRRMKKRNVIFQLENFFYNFFSCSYSTFQNKSKFLKALKFFVFFCLHKVRYTLFGPCYLLSDLDKM